MESFSTVYFAAYSARGKFNSLASTYNSSSLRIDDNPTLTRNEGETVRLYCRFSSVKEAVLREVVWYREMDERTNAKLLTYDAVMNITQVGAKIEFVMLCNLYS